MISIGPVEIFNRVRGGRGLRTAKGFGQIGPDAGQGIGQAGFMDHAPGFSDPEMKALWPARCLRNSLDRINPLALESFRTNLSRSPLVRGSIGSRTAPVKVAA